MAIEVKAGTTTSETSFTAVNGAVSYEGRISRGGLSNSISGSIKKGDNYVGSYNFSVSHNTENVLTDDEKAAILADVKELINQL